MGIIAPYLQSMINICWDISVSEIASSWIYQNSNSFLFQVSPVTSVGRAYDDKFKLDL